MPIRDFRGFLRHETEEILIIIHKCMNSLRNAKKKPSLTLRSPQVGGGNCHWEPQRALPVPRGFQEGPARRLCPLQGAVGAEGVGAPGRPGLVRTTRGHAAARRARVPPLPPGGVGGRDKWGATPPHGGALGSQGGGPCCEAAPTRVVPKSPRNQLERKPGGLRMMPGWPGALVSQPSVWGGSAKPLCTWGKACSGDLAADLVGVMHQVPDLGDTEWGG